MNSEELKAYDLAVENHERAMARVAELEREVERLNMDCNEACADSMEVARELAALKAQPGGVVPVAEIRALLANWDDLKEGDSLNVDAVRGWLTRLNQQPAPSPSKQGGE